MIVLNAWHLMINERVSRGLVAVCVVFIMGKRIQAANKYQSCTMTHNLRSAINWNSEDSGIQFKRNWLIHQSVVISMNKYLARVCVCDNFIIFNLLRLNLRKINSNFWLFCLKIKLKFIYCYLLNCRILYCIWSELIQRVKKYR